MLKASRNVLAAVLVLQCSCSVDQDGPAKKTGDPMEKGPEIKSPYLFMHRFRSAEKDFYKIELWLGVGSQGTPINPRSSINPGFRVYLPEGSEDKAPETFVLIELKDATTKNLVASATARPILKKTAIDGGYWEAIRIDDLNGFDKKEKFIGMKGVWEINLDDPFNMDWRKPKMFAPPPGEYLLSVRIAINGGPTIQCEDIPFRQRMGRGPEPSKKSK